MPFSEAVKITVRRKAHLSCCICHSFGVDIHHIIPQADGGLDTENNAAPLCPNCHRTYGSNPVQRKIITEARDLWYELCEKRYGPDTDRLDRVLNAVEGLIFVLPEYLELIDRMTGQHRIEPPFAYTSNPLSQSLITQSVM